MTSVVAFGDSRMNGYQEEFLSIKEFALLIGVHPNTIRRSIKSGHLSAFRVNSGSRSIYRIAKSEIHRIALVDLETIINKIVDERIKTERPALPEAT